MLQAAKTERTKLHTLQGGKGNDTLYGNEGNNYLYRKKREGRGAVRRMIGAAAAPDRRDRRPMHGGRRTSLERVGKTSCLASVTGDTVGLRVLLRPRRAAAMAEQNLAGSLRYSLTTF